MAITFGVAKKLLSRYYGTGGRCPTADGINLFVIQVLQYLLYQGESGNLRAFSFYAKDGCITLPYELETPLKVKIDAVVGNVFTSFFSYHSNMRMDDCLPAQDALYDEPNLYPTVYDIPACGGKVGIVATCKEAADAAVIIKGVDLTGREIFTVHQGENVVGAQLTPTKGKFVHSSVVFGKITEIVKPRLNGYLQLYSMDSVGARTFLADYSPVEENPQYRRMRVKTRGGCPDKARVTVLGRIRLKSFYADEDLIPFDNYLALATAAQAVNANYNGDADTAGKKDIFMQQLIEKEGNYKKVNNGQALEVSPLTSGGAIKNLFNRSRFGSWGVRR